jgi:hypothetical protein
MQGAAEVTWHTADNMGIGRQPSFAPFYVSVTKLPGAEHLGRNSAIPSKTWMLNTTVRT